MHPSSVFAARCAHACALHAGRAAGAGRGLPRAPLLVASPPAPAPRPCASSAGREVQRGGGGGLPLPLPARRRRQFFVRSEGGRSLDAAAVRTLYETVIVCSSEAVCVCVLHYCGVLERARAARGGVSAKAVKESKAGSDSVGGVKSGGCDGGGTSGAEPAASPLGVGAVSARACGGADEERCVGAVASEEDDCVIVCARDAEERSDSGVSGLRSGGSGDERSGSRSSALSDEPPPAAQPAAPAWRAMAHGAGYAGGAPPPLLHHLPPPAPPTLYPGPEMLWKPRYQQQPVSQLHHHQQHHMQHQDYLAVLDRDRERHERLLRYESLSAEHEASLGPLLMTYYDTSTKLRDYRVASSPNQPRERRDQEQRELHEKQQQQKEKERERMEREREREKAEREKQDREERERTREEKLVQNDSATKLVRKHFEESLRLANEKRERERATVSWSIIQNLAPPPARPPDHERLRQPDPRDRPYYPPTSVPVSHPQQPQRPTPPPPAHGRLSMPKQPEKQSPHPGLPKAEPNFAPYGYPSYRAPPYEKLKQETQHLPAPPPLVQEKNSVIVKHDTKPQIHLEQKHQYKTAHYLATRPYRTGLSPHAPHPPHPPHPPPQASPHAALPAHDPPKPRARAYQPPPPRSPAYYCPTQQIRPKVSSPAPSHMYGKPTAPQDSPPVPYPPPSAYSPVPRQHLPPPPPAHSRTPEPRPQPSPTSLRPEPCQTQPLDLGMVIRDDPDRSPRRRFPFDPAADPSDAKRRRLTPDLSTAEPTPLIASAAAAVSGRAPHGSDPVPQAPGPLCDVRVPSADGSVETPEKAAGASPAPSVTPAASPAPQPASSPPAPTPPPPAPAPTPPASVINNDAETPAKTSSPAPAPSPKDNSAPVRHLGKKAWLQRHETAPIGEGERSGGGGVCVTLPMTVQSRVEPEEIPAPVAAPPVATKSVLHRIGSMAVNSIGRTKTPKGRKPAKETNGRIDDARDGEDSSSSDRDTSERAQPKRKPPKAKRRKGAGARKTPDEPKKKKASESGSGSDSDKESDGDKDSDSGGSGGAAGRRGGGRARGRRARGSGGVRGSGNGRRKDEPPAPRRQPQAGRLRRSGESFLQDGNCTEVAPRLTKCRECRWSPQQQRDKDMPNIFCRFYAFRRLRYAKNGQLAIAGFSDPYKDAEEEDKKLWLNSSGAADLDIEMSCFLLREIGDQFCELLQQEREAGTHHLNDDKTLAWKRVVQGVREMCDVCETTLFNLHWTCGKCGFVVCLDCYKSRTSGEASPTPSPASDAATNAASERDAHGWLTCAGGAHAPRKLLLTQIAAGDALQVVTERCHRARALWGLPACGACPAGSKPPAVDSELASQARCLLRAAMHENIKNEEVKEENGPLNGLSPVKTENCKNGSTTLSWLADVALSPSIVKNENSDSSSSDSEEGNFSTLRELLIRPAPAESTETPRKKHKKNKDIVDAVISRVMHSKPDEKSEEDIRRDAVRIMTLAESRLLYPEVPHSWLCDGKLLHLTDPIHQGNYKPFQDQWKRGQPVLVSDVFTQLDKNLWTPASFSRDFGDTRSDLINCASGLVVPNQPARKFWDGFELVAKRLRDERGAPMVLKLKDWPPGEDFAELLPSRFSDLMNALPLREYTARAGRLNLAARLPECFVRPDLGPKMYTAYGGAGGTTNLHLDVSDAVNVMVHASAPADAPERAREAARAADEAGADVLSRRRARLNPPGALWHIYAARDADKIRDFLVSAEVERGGRPRPSHDPVHDQTWYLDAALRERLYREYGVEGYAVLQCPGDAVFVPAGAPHQVRNLLDCIKVAEDFVSPENVSRCFELAQQFRRLSRQHANKEDKLQIKNIVYHAVKDSLCRLEGALGTSSARL